MQKSYYSIWLKYLTKIELNISKGVAAIIWNILKKTVESRLSTQAVINHVKFKLLGECMISK